ncbi:MAG: ubiquinone/menaquinone biosynthesis methyltransferase [Planctomycetota bacterium]
MPEAPKVRRLFAAIARRYDLANDVLSGGTHRLWRRRLVRRVGIARGVSALDVCCGTGDLARAMRRAGAKVIGVDFCQEMVALAARKAGPDTGAYAVGDALQLPFPDAAFDVATVAFGIRNVADPVVGLREMARVCRPGGRVVVLEFCRPRAPVFASVYGLYFRRILPRLGALVSGDRQGAYRYLQETVDAFPERDAFLRLMRAAGLENPRYEVLSLGIASIYQGEVPLRRIAITPGAACNQAGGSSEVGGPVRAEIHGSTLRGAISPVFAHGAASPPGS